jgi:hypothetical protein
VKLQLAPIEFKYAADFVRVHHRHHTPPVGHKFSIAAMDAGELVGVVIVGRPVARCRDDGKTLEVTRLCTKFRARLLADWHIHSQARAWN